MSPKHMDSSFISPCVILTPALLSRQEDLGVVFDGICVKSVINFREKTSSGFPNSKVQRFF